jgi:hypothetical protein
MSGAQTLLVIGAIILLGSYILMINSSIAVSQETSIKNSIMNESITYMEEKVNEISVRSFDAVDDYDGYNQIDTTENGGVFRTLVNIDYVNPADPNSVSQSETSMKRISVSVFPDSAYRKTILLIMMISLQCIIIKVNRSS